MSAITTTTPNIDSKPAQIVQVAQVWASYIDGPMPIEHNINEWLRINKITTDNFIKVTIHCDKAYSGYPSPNDYCTSYYALVYYTIEQ